jgi:hypothetical protein
MLWQEFTKMKIIHTCHSSAVSTLSDKFVIVDTKLITKVCVFVLVGLFKKRKKKPSQKRETQTLWKWLVVKKEERM